MQPQPHQDHRVHFFRNHLHTFSNPHFCSFVEISWSDHDFLCILRPVCPDLCYFTAIFLLTCVIFNMEAISENALKNILVEPHTALCLKLIYELALMLDVILSCICCSCLKSVVNVVCAFLIWCHACEICQESFDLRTKIDGNFISVYSYNKTLQKESFVIF